LRISNFKRAKAGDKAARQALVCANLRFVVSVARDYKNYGLSLVELVSVGNLGLMEAVKRFDETRGFNFITYAVWWIRQAILKALAEQGKIARPPMSQMSDWRKIDRATNALAQALGRAPTFDEIVARTDMSAERTRNALKFRSRTSPWTHLHFPMMRLRWRRSLSPTKKEWIFAMSGRKWRRRSGRA